jgi:uncharacterized RDD family membrane protein YckC
MDVELNPYAAPQSQVLTRPVPVSGFPLAQRRRRILAGFVDLIVLIVVMFILAFTIFFFEIGRMGSEQQFSFGFSTDEPFWGTVTFFVGLAINWVFLANGQTLGMKLLGIQVVLVDDLPCERARFVIRRELPLHLWSLITFWEIGTIITVIDVLMLFRSDKRMLHDMIAGTKVVDIRPRIG